MRQRVLAILNRLKEKGAEGISGSIMDFEAKLDRTFELQTNRARHKTFFTYETTGADEILRIELTHYFGHLDLSKADNPAQFLFGMLEQNVPSFRSSGACLGLKANSPFPLVCLSATHQFLNTLRDEDIVEALSTMIFDLKMGLLFTFPPPIVTWD